MFLFKDVNPIAKTPGDLCCRSAAREPVRTIPRHCIPEGSATDGETDEAFNACGGDKPASHLRFIGTTAQHDAANPVAPAAARYGDDTLAIGTTVKTFYFSDIGLNACSLQVFNCLLHQRRAQLSIKRILAAIHAGELVTGGWD